MATIRSATLPMASACRSSTGFPIAWLRYSMSPSMTRDGTGPRDAGHSGAGAGADRVPSNSAGVVPPMIVAGVLPQTLGSSEGDA